MIIKKTSRLLPFCVELPHVSVVFVDIFICICRPWLLADYYIRHHYRQYCCHWLLLTKPLLLFYVWCLYNGRVARAWLDFMANACAVAERQWRTISFCYSDLYFVILYPSVCPLIGWLNYDKCDIKKKKNKKIFLFYQI